MKIKLNCILIIDDDEPTNFISRILIEDFDCAENIKIIQSSAEALKYLAQCEHSNPVNNFNQCPQLILLDINMPAMNGWEFLEQYEKFDKTFKDKIVVEMLTTSMNPDDRLKAEKIKTVAGFEIKPLTTRKLDLMLKQHFASNF
ncbi:MAG: response regulator [Ferruginibacter sp.]